MDPVTMVMINLFGQFWYFFKIRDKMFNLRLVLI